VAEKMTQVERLTRIETLLEQAVLQRNEDRDAMRKTIETMAADIKQIKDDVAADKAELATLKRSGGAFLAGAALAGGGIATGIGHFLGLIK
jgi:DNA-binding protein H-NS